MTRPRWLWIWLGLVALVTAGVIVLYVCCLVEAPGMVVPL